MQAKPWTGLVFKGKTRHECQLDTTAQKAQIARHLASTVRWDGGCDGGIEPEGARDAEGQVTAQLILKTKSGTVSMTRYRLNEDARAFGDDRTPTKMAAELAAATKLTADQLAHMNCISATSGMPRIHS
eukprot:scaffold23735_cov122-Isochrysis_galbana.AAC.2